MDQSKFESYKCPRGQEHEVAVKLYSLVQISTVAMNNRP